jgi:hypothetical protein
VIDKPSHTMFNKPVIIADSQLAMSLFLNVTIAHDKGKPVVRQGRKAVSLSEVGSFRASRRLSGCRKRSEKVQALKTPAPLPQTVSSFSVCLSRLQLEQRRLLKLGFLILTTPRSDGELASLFRLLRRTLSTALISLVPAFLSNQPNKVSAKATLRSRCLLPVVIEPFQLRLSNHATTNQRYSAGAE